MAVTAHERKLLVDGEWIETGAWHEVRSPYSGEVVGRVAAGGADETRRAVDAAGRGDDRAAARSRARGRSSTASPTSSPSGRTRSRARSRRGRQAAEGRPRRGRARRLDLTSAAAEARKLAGDVVPMDASPAGTGKLAFTMRVPIGVVAAISPFNFPLQPRRAQGRARARGRLRGRAQAREPDPALRAPARRAGDGGRASRRVAERGRRAVRPRSATCWVEDERVKLISFTGSVRGRLEAARARRAEEGAARARERDAGDRRGRRRHRGDGGEDWPRTPSRSPARAASPMQRDLRARGRLRRLPRPLPPQGEALTTRRPARRRDGRRPGDRRRREGADPRLDRRGEGAGSDGPRGRRDLPTDGLIRRRCWPT